MSIQFNKIKDLNNKEVAKEIFEEIRNPLKFDYKKQYFKDEYATTWMDDPVFLEGFEDVPF
jgi:hypothetical protein